MGRADARDCKSASVSKNKTRDITNSFSGKCVLCDYLSLSMRVIYDSNKNIIQKFQLFSLSPKDCLACSTSGFFKLYSPKILAFART